MKKLTLLFITLALCSAFAKDEYPLTITVKNTQNVSAEHGTFHMGWGGGSGGAGWSHAVAEHAYAEGNDGNMYELVPQNHKDMLLPGTYRAEIQKHDMKVCKPKNGNSEKCDGVKFSIIHAEPMTSTAPTGVPAAATAEAKQ